MADKMRQDRLCLVAPPKPRQVEMHADDAQRRAVDRQIGEYRAARGRKGKVIEPRRKDPQLTLPRPSPKP